jgi:ParB family chromosome partitioning protein
MDQITLIPIEKVTSGEHALRHAIAKEAVEDLAESIRRMGVLCPLVVQQKDDSYVVIFGHRRLAAALLAGRTEIPCIIKTESTATVKEMAFAENFFRADLSAVEQAASIKDVLDSGTMDVTQLAAGFHRSEHWIKAQVDLLCWPDDVLFAVHTGWLSVAAASNISLITDDTYRAFLLRNAEDGGCTARVSASWLQAWRSMAPPEEALQADPVPDERSHVPSVPQSPCICCNEVNRTDGMSMVLMCSACINTMRNPQLS